MCRIKFTCATALIVSIFSVSQTWADDALLQGFENLEQVHQWEVRKDKWDAPLTEKVLKVSSNDKWKTQGEHSLRMEFAKFEPGRPQWPGLSLKASLNQFSVTDWSRYGELAMDIHNCCDKDVKVACEVRDDLSKNGHTESITVAPDQTRTLRIDLYTVWKASLENADIRNVKEIIIFTTRPSSRLAYCIDNIRLIDNKRTLETQELANWAQIAVKSLQPGPIRSELDAEIADLQKRISDGKEPAETFMKKFNAIRRKAETSRYQPEHSYNFGPADVDMESGWKDADTRDYTKSQGFGWVDGKASLSTFRFEYAKVWARSESKIYPVLKRPPVYLNLQEQGGVIAYGPATFRVDVPNGHYRVFAVIGYSGGLNVCPVDMNVSINGSKNAYRVTLPNQHIFRTVVWKADVTDRKLDITFSGNGGRQWLVNAIQIWPEKNNALAMAEVVEPLREDISILPVYERAKWRDVRNAPAPRKNIPAEAEQSGLAVFQTNTLSDYISDYTPEKYGLPEGVSVQSARNEIATASFGLMPLGNADETLTVTCSELKGDNGDAKGRTIPASAVRVELVRNIPWPLLFEQRKEIIEMPRILDRAQDGRYDIKPWNVRQAYVMVDLSGKEPAGNYRGTITLQTGNLAKVELPIRLDVLPIVLKANPKLSYGAYWYWYTEKKESRVKAEMADMKSHGFNMIGPHGTGPSCRPTKVNGKIVWSFEDAQFKQIKPLAQKYGFKRAPYCFGDELIQLSQIMSGGKTLQKNPRDIGLPQEYYDNITEMIKQLLEWDKVNGYGGEMLLYPLDEIIDANLAYKIALAIKRVPNATLFCNSVPLIINQLGSLVDVACWAYPVGTEVEMQKLIKSKPAITSWTYPNNTTADQRAAGRMLWGFCGLKIGFEGLWPWAYQSPSGSYDTPFDGDYPDCLIAYPDIDKPVSTVQYEAIRQGIDDGRYLYTLQSLIAQARKSRNPKLMQAAGDAELAIENAMTPMPLEYRKPEANAWAQQNLNNVRQILIEAILKLQNAIAANNEK